MFIKTSSSGIMKTKIVHLGEKFDLPLQESVAVEDTNVILTTKSVARLMVPKQGDQFILVLTVACGEITEDVNLDGPFQFPTNAVKVQGGNYLISVPDIDHMARFATLVIEKVPAKPMRTGKNLSRIGKK